MGVPQNHPYLWDVPIINDPFLGTPSLGKPHMIVYTHYITIYIYCILIYLLRVIHKLMPFGQLT